MSQLTQRVPVGFRFHPTDEELVGYYLPKKVTARKIDLDLIRDLDLYKLEPWDLEDLCKIQADSSEKQTDYYFFSRKDRKYPTGNRANRATTKGFWKATGRDKPIHMTKLQTLIGMRKTLVFYQGRAPHGVKTDWIMHEFRLDDGPGHPAHDDGGWVVCRVFKKNKNLKMKPDERATVSYEEAHQLGQFVPELASSPEILSCGGRFAYPDRSQYGGCVKQEFINLDTYGEPDQSHSMPSTSDEARSYLTRALSLRKCDEDYLLNVPYDGETTSSGATSDAGATTDPEDCSTFLGLPENLDWSLLLQESQKTPASDPVLVPHLKRQNSDVFSSLELWNYAQVAQQL